MILLVLILFVLSILEIGYSQKINPYNVNVSSISVSGVSSGGAMAIQYHIAHSSDIIGAGIIAGPPYWCANDNVQIALGPCAKYPRLISITELRAATSYAYSVGSIDNPENIANSRVWLFSGSQDTIVNPGVVAKTRDYYLGYVRNSEDVIFVNSIPAAHAWITDDYGSNCSFLGFPYINDCNYDAAGEFLQHIYGDLHPPTESIPNNLLKFNQQYYTPLQITPSVISMDNTGFVYVPTGCQNGNICSLHVSFHGCLMGFSLEGTLFVLNSGINEWAESNNIIVLYPQATVSELIPYNPKGCWDWWGYTGADYATALGVQINTIENMIQTLCSGNSTN